MSITLSDGTTTVTLHEDLKWTDEFTWSAIEQTVNRSLTGGFIVQRGARTDGRPITLEPEGEDSAWMPRSTVLALRAMANDLDAELTLTIRGEARSVAFRHHDQNGGLEAVPLVHFRDADVSSSDYYRCTLRFMEITL